jgi:hypothetical protein
VVRCDDNLKAHVRLWILTLPFRARTCEPLPHSRLRVAGGRAGQSCGWPKKLALRPGGVEFRQRANSRMRRGLLIGYYSCCYWCSAVWRVAYR